MNDDKLAIDAHTQTADAGSEDAHEGSGSRIAGVASSIAGHGGQVISAALTPVRSLASGANRIIGERPGARVRRVRQSGHHDLANLWDVHPDARRASIRELGLQSIAVDQIKGTAVEGAPQRGGDFLPLKGRRSDDWRGRWQRILDANERLEVLPPIELIRFDDEYWVVDGHNRVAAALYNGQIELDAVVEELRLPGMSNERGEAAATMAPVLEGSLDLRAAGTGRLSRTVNRPDDLEGVQRAHDRDVEMAAADDADLAAADEEAAE